jgi:ubiquinone/menaquinone biosynthesis C-methylase UbiE
MTTEPRYILAPFVPTPPDIVDRMLALAEVKSADLIYDLGCGDGRILFAGAKLCSARGLGIDIEQHWVEQGQRNAKQAGIDHLVAFKAQDAMTADLSPATVIMLYLARWSTRSVQPLIQKMAKPGTRIVSHNFNMDNWEPARVDELVDSNGDAHTLYLWIVQ